MVVDSGGGTTSITRWHLQGCSRGVRRHCPSSRQHHPQLLGWLSRTIASLALDVACTPRFWRRTISCRSVASVGGSYRVKIRHIEREKKVRKRKGRERNRSHGLPSQRCHSRIREYLRLFLEEEETTSRRRRRGRRRPGSRRRRPSSGLNASIRPMA
ncbi:unnamed protein product [Musa acuminata var. zebrina]